MKKVFFIVGMLAMFVGSPVFAKAESINEESAVTQINLDEGIKHSESEVLSESGEYMGKIVINEESSTDSDAGIQSRSLIYNETVKNKNYNVHFIGTTANVGFGITVKNKNITKAYDPWSNGLIWDVSIKKLTRTNKEAKLPGRATFGIKGISANTTFKLRAVISGNQLLTYLDIP